MDQKKKNILQYADGLGHHLTLHKICELIRLSTR